MDEGVETTGVGGPSGGAPACPPHHWDVSAVPAGKRTVQHHRCRRCGAEKVVDPAASARPWIQRARG